MTHLALAQAVIGQVMISNSGNNAAGTRTGHASPSSPA
jgi:hypothetical protein